MAPGHSAPWPLGQLSTLYLFSQSELSDFTFTYRHFFLHCPFSWCASFLLSIFSHYTSFSFLTFPEPLPFSSLSFAFHWSSPGAVYACVFMRNNYHLEYLQISKGGSPSLQTLKHHGSCLVCV